LNLHTTLSLDTAARACLSAPPAARRFNAADFPRLRSEFERCARDYYALSAGGKPLALLSMSLQLSPEDDLELRAVYAPPTASPLILEAVGLRGMPPATGMVLTVTGRRSFLGQKLLHPDDPRFERAITQEGEEVGTPPLPVVESTPVGAARRRMPFALLLLIPLTACAYFALRRRR